MPTPRHLDAIEHFFATKRLAMVGLSRDPKHFSTVLFRELLRRGYDVIPVNPRTPEIDGHRTYLRVQDIQPPVDAALLMTPAAATDAAVADCAQAGVRQIWLYSAGSGGAVTESALAFCRDYNIEVVPGECPFMFLPQNGMHAVHGWINKLIGRYPKHAA
ncbi:MAG TPA: CoA-binding protein [Candidatus Acidoferrum sp.]|jgi:predicted CoA-binding protein|nr:CoA-binding protein [Candidatus Acidoferrum sp.]